GILDRGHIRFFTRRSFERLVSIAGFRIVRRTGTGLPVEVVDRGGGDRRTGSGRAARALAWVDRAAVAARPELFAYQLVYELEPTPMPSGSGSDDTD
ncbi:MAG: hypothetical protein ACXW1M_09295, partial [Acidimicrobiia bacterium]